MDRVEGEPLIGCWDRLSSFRRLRVACTLRLYIRQLHALRRSQLGTLGTGLVGGLFFQFDGSESKEFGPYESVQGLRRFCTFAAHLGWQRLSQFQDGERSPPPQPQFDWSPVFVHGDLNMANILLDRRGTVWLIDWAWAGFYPACLDTLAMRHSNLFALKDIVPASWERYRGFIAGPSARASEAFWHHVFMAMPLLQ
ncbi:hypothetical protein PENSPDRAFT_171139 [Peniophora sp. CONT]|nr:hypothetical protein PENSPDRAFT_171139 [Peniophora sp. CONT]